MTQPPNNDPFANLVPPHIETLSPYQPGKPIEELQRELGIADIVKIASNENPLGPSPKAVEAATRSLADLNMYPDGGCYALRAALSERLEVGPDHLAFGAGSDEIIAMIVRAFCGPTDQVVTHQYAFISYKLAAAAAGVEFVEAPVTEDLACDPDALIASFSERTRVVFLANPNNPTGSYVTRPDFERILEAVPARALLVMDEAYHEYATEIADDYPRSMEYQADKPLLLTLRTFSKIYGLAGLRVGYAIGHPRVTNYINRVRRAFNVTSAGQAAALAALDDDAHVNRSRTENASGVAKLKTAAEGLGLRAYPSLGNFVLVDVGRDPVPVYQSLLERGVIVRPMVAWGLKQHLRISVATDAATERVTTALADVLG